MSDTALPVLLPAGAYPERDDAADGWFDKLVHSAMRPIRKRTAARPRAWARLVAAVADAGRALDGLSDAVLVEAAMVLRGELRRHGFRDDLVARAFALVREVAGRALGQRHYDVQLIGGFVMLQGMVAEMETGEGKTLTATLAAGTAALAGLPVHVITVNDYLAARDAEIMRPVFATLGLSVGLVGQGMSPDARRAAYACDVTYCTNKELTFDYLRDRLVLGRRPTRLQLTLERLGGDQARLRRVVLRGLVFGIVDEADSVLVDEARTPLIISGGGGSAPERKLYDAALELARGLEVTRDFVLGGAERGISLTEAGRLRLDAMAEPLGGLWRGRQRREELVRQALTALHMLERDRDYLVRDGKVQIIDEFTGRLFADRSWERGLHQLIETKEGCQLTTYTEPLARMSYQRFFRRYLRLAGMTGTGAEVAGELWSVYRLMVVHVPTNRPVARRGGPDRIYASADDKWDAVVGRITELHRARRPVLVGTRSVGASEHLSGLLTAAGLAHDVLNARQDGDEADIVARAGEAGRITVATNMAGRGTDIRLGAEVKNVGGLAVIATERHEAGRIDRQLFGRCGRQGDPGTFEAILSLEDDIVVTHGSAFVRWLARVWPERFGGIAVRHAQRSAERLHARTRGDLLRYDEQLETALAFAGRLE